MFHLFHHSIISTYWSSYQLYLSLKGKLHAKINQYHYQSFFLIFALGYMFDYMDHICVFDYDNFTSFLLLLCTILLIYKCFDDFLFLVSKLLLLLTRLENFPQFLGTIDWVPYPIIFICSIRLIYWLQLFLRFQIKGRLTHQRKKG